MRGAVIFRMQGCDLWSRDTASLRQFHRKEVRKIDTLMSLFIPHIFPQGFLLAESNQKPRAREPSDIVIGYAVGAHPLRLTLPVAMCAYSTVSA